MMDQEQKDERRAAEFLLKGDGEWFMGWLKDKMGVEKPIYDFSEEDPLNTKRALLKEGGRQAWGLLNDLTNEYKNSDE